MEAGSRRLQAIVELVADELTGLRLHVNQASRPGAGASQGENVPMGLPPPRFGRRAAGQAMGQLPEFCPVPVLLRESPHRRVRGCPPVLPELQRATLRVAAKALALNLALAGTRFLADTWARLAIPRRPRADSPGHCRRCVRFVLPEQPLAHTSRWLRGTGCRHGWAEPGERGC